MTSEVIWLRGYSEDGEPPHCRRLIRQPRQLRWTAAIDLAVSLAEVGRATGLNVASVSVICRKPRSDCWLIPELVARRARELFKSAIVCGCRAGGGSAYREDIARVLEKWRADGQWRRHIAAPDRKGDLISYRSWSRRIDRTITARAARRA